MEMPPKSREQLAAEREQALREFEAERTTELQAQIERRYDEITGGLRRLFDASADLRDLDAALQAAFDEQPSWAPDRARGTLLDALRFVAMPPIGGEDIQGLSRVTRRHVRLSPDEERRFAELLELRIDRRRFPWLMEQREPSECDLEVATTATAMLAIAQSLPIIRRQVLTSFERRLPDTLTRLGWEMLPTGVPLKHLAAGTFTQLPGSASGADLALRFPDGRLALADVKVAPGGAQKGPTYSRRRTRSTAHPEGSGPSDMQTPDALLNVFYGAPDLDSLLELQASGVTPVFGSFLKRVFSLSDEREDPTNSISKETAPMAHPRSDEYSVAPPPTPTAPDETLARAELVVRAAAARTRDGIGVPAHTGRLGRRKGVPYNDGYLAQYVHFDRTPGDRWAVWLYFAAEDHPYSVPGYPSGYWVGLKHDAAKELNELEWQRRLEPDFTWMTHVADRWSGFRHFFAEASEGENPDQVAAAMAEWTVAALKRHELVPK